MVAVADLVYLRLPAPFSLLQTSPHPRRVTTNHFQGSKACRIKFLWTRKPRSPRLLLCHSHSRSILVGCLAQSPLVVCRPRNQKRKFSGDLLGSILQAAPRRILCRHPRLFLPLLLQNFLLSYPQLILHCHLCPPPSPQRPLINSEVHAVCPDTCLTRMSTYLLISTKIERSRTLRENVGARCQQGLC